MPIYADHRPLYKIAQILLVLAVSSRGGKSSMIRLHLFNWVMKENKRKDLLVNAAKNGGLNINVWGLDPFLNSAIQFALAERLVERCSNGISITEKGKVYIKIIQEDQILDEEYLYFKSLGKRITETMIEKASESWG